MQVNRIEPVVPNKLENTANKVNNKNNVSFKAPLDGFALSVANAIENGGLAVSFTLQDMIGTNIPRPVMGLMRNKKENKGEKNIKFAAKELVREMMTGPSMFLIPMGMLAVGKKLVGSAIDVPIKMVKSFADIHAQNPLNELGNAISKEDFYKNTFSQIIKNAKSETAASEETVRTAASFANRLVTGIGNKKQTKETIKALADDFVDIAKSHASDAVHTDFTTAVVSNTAAAPFKKTVEHMMSYADDAVAKAGKQAPDKVVDYVKKLGDNKVLSRLATNIILYAAIMGFLQVIPKLYNKAEGKNNEGLKGLMKEETLKDTSLNSQKPENKTQKQALNSTTAKTIDKSKPSFGSLPIVDKLAGNGLVGKLAGGIEFEGCNVSFPLLLGIMGFGIILPRTKRAKDKYDREEILRRDVVTCATMCFAEKELRKGFSKLNETKYGLVLAVKEEGFKDKSIFKRVFDYLRPIKGVQVLSSDQIASKYSGIDKYKEGIKGFCEFIDSQGGNLGKVFSVTDQSKAIVSDLLTSEGAEISTAGNQVIKDVLTKPENATKVKELTDLFADKNNAWVTKARTLNARFTALSVLVLVPLFLGILLPKINEHATKKRIKKEEAEQDAAMKNHSNVSFASQEVNSSKIFADIDNFTR